MPAASEDSVSPPVIPRVLTKMSAPGMDDDPTLSLDGSPQAPVDVPPALGAWAIFACSIGSDMAGSARSTVRGIRAWEREVALKLLLPNSVGGDEEYRALLREARRWLPCSTPTSCTFTAIDRHDGRVGFWTDFVHGKTLSALIRAQGRLAIARPR